MIRSSIRSLLIADDDQDDQLLLKEAIQNLEGLEMIRTVSDGIQLITALKVDPLPDLVLLDLNMPNKNGIECLNEIRSGTHAINIPLVVLSTSKDPHDIEACFNSGANLFFSKPYTFRELKSLVLSILSIDWITLSRQRLDKHQFTEIASSGEISQLLLSF